MARRKDRRGAPDPSEAPAETEPEQIVDASEIEESEPTVEVQPTPEPVPAPPPDVPVSKPGRVHCEAIRTCLTPGEPTFAGGRFWMDPEGAERLRLRGDLKIL